MPWALHWCDMQEYFFGLFEAAVGKAYEYTSNDLAQALGSTRFGTRATLPPQVLQHLDEIHDIVPMGASTSSSSMAA